MSHIVGGVSDEVQSRVELVSTDDTFFIHVINKVVIDQVHVETEILQSTSLVLSLGADVVSWEQNLVGFWDIGEWVSLFGDDLDKDVLFRIFQAVNGIEGSLDSVIIDSTSTDQDEESVVFTWSLSFRSLLSLVWEASSPETNEHIWQWDEPEDVQPGEGWCASIVLDFIVKILHVGTENCHGEHNHRLKPIKLFQKVIDLRRLCRFQEGS